MSVEIGERGVRNLRQHGFAAGWDHDHQEAVLIIVKEEDRPMVVGEEVREE